MIMKMKSHDSWIDAYRGICQCVSADKFNMVAINVTNAIPHWKIVNPFKIYVKSQGLKQYIDSLRGSY
mgnify:CR=1 FL=1